MAPGSGRRTGLAAQAFALLGTAVGLFTIAVGIGPRTSLDLALHSGMIVLLVTGLMLASRQRVGSA
jgi:multisubunit Na+/H+ antiporter MnhB subunit